MTDEAVLNKVLQISKNPSFTLLQTVTTIHIIFVFAVENIKKIVYRKCKVLHAASYTLRSNM